MTELLQAVYDCDFCKRLGFGFTRPANRKGFYKFPPTIGAPGAAPLLFIGINPRRSESNQDLHELIMRDEEAFRSLSQNKVNGLRYIGTASNEGHYSAHLRIVRSAFGDGAEFEEHAVVTELFFCGTEDAEGLAKMKSPCANTYLEAVLDQVKPQLVVSVGKTVMAYLRWKFEGEGEDGFQVELSGKAVKVVRIVHPNDTKACAGEPERLLHLAEADARALTAS